MELDGEHRFQSGRDAARDAWLAARGWSALRSWNRELLENPEGVVRALLEAPRGRGAKVVAD